MKISIVIPVYNAERFLRSAVASALADSETTKVVLVEDGSPDGCLAICHELARLDKRVRLVRHPNGENRGAGPSRNLGIHEARYDYIAFLDADDYYVPSRFANASRILSANPEIDGVYEAVGAEFESADAEQRYYKTHTDEMATLRDRVAPEALFEYLITVGGGYIHLDGLVVKRDSLIRVGLFPELRLHQDTVLALKLAARCRLEPGDLEKPVAIRRLHHDNRITDPRNDFPTTRLAAAQNLYEWAIEEALAPSTLAVLRRRYYRARYVSLMQQKKYVRALYCFVNYRQIPGLFSR